MAESGQIPSLDGFLVSTPKCDVQALETVDRMVLDEENAKNKKDLKGKGKAIEKGKGRAIDQGNDGEMSMLVDVGDQMNDITNSKHFFWYFFWCLYIPHYRHVSRGPNSTLRKRETQAT